MINVTEFILWIIISSSGGVSQQAALFPSYKACDDAKVQILKATSAWPPWRGSVVAECLARFPEK